MNKNPFYDLDSPIYLFGVPTVLFLLELGSAIFLIFVFKANIVLSIAIVVTVHLLVAFLCKWSPNWVMNIIFFIFLPYTRVYKDNVAYVPSENELKE